MKRYKQMRVEWDEMQQVCEMGYYPVGDVYPLGKAEIQHDIDKICGTGSMNIHKLLNDEDEKDEEAKGEIQEEKEEHMKEEKEEKVKKSNRIGDLLNGDNVQFNE